jgi:hypothetical protein
MEIHMNNALKSLIAAGIAVSVTLPVFAAEPVPADPAGHMQNLPPDERKASAWMREEWQKSSPEQRAEMRRAMREHWESMSPQERRDMREKMKEHWQAMSPQEREARRNEMREHWQNMSPQEREKFKNDLRGNGESPPFLDHTDSQTETPMPK